MKALDRSRLLRDVSNALSEQHVNIVACSTHTGSDRIARMRFEFGFCASRAGACLQVTVGRARAAVTLAGGRLRGCSTT